jgi:hypothetical protein
MSTLLLLEPAGLVFEGVRFNQVRDRCCQIVAVVLEGVSGLV